MPRVHEEPRLAPSPSSASMATERHTQSCSVRADGIPQYSIRSVIATEQQRYVALLISPGELLISPSPRRTPAARAATPDSLVLCWAPYFSLRDSQTKRATHYGDGRWEKLCCHTRVQLSQGLAQCLPRLTQVQAHGPSLPMRTPRSIDPALEIARELGVLSIRTFRSPASGQTPPRP
jgi:hypothetical protein